MGMREIVTRIHRNKLHRIGPHRLIYLMLPLKLFLHWTSVTVIDCLSLVTLWPCVQLYFQEQNVLLSFPVFKLLTYWKGIYTLFRIDAWTRYLFQFNFLSLGISSGYMLDRDIWSSSKFNFLLLGISIVTS